MCQRGSGTKPFLEGTNMAGVKISKDKVVSAIIFMRGIKPESRVSQDLTHPPAIGGKCKSAETMILNISNNMRSKNGIT